MDGLCADLETYAEDCDVHFASEQLSSLQDVQSELPLESESKDSFSEANSAGRKKKRGRSPFYTPLLEISLPSIIPQVCAVDCRIVNKNLFLLARYRGMALRCHFMKRVFSAGEMADLLMTLNQCNYWQRRVDSRGDRMTCISGYWTAQGRFNPGDPLHPAGIGGVKEESCERLHLHLKKLAERLPFCGQYPSIWWGFGNRWFWPCF